LIRFMRLTAFAKQFRELCELTRRQVPKLLAAALADWLVKLLKKLQAGAGNANLHDAAVVGGPTTFDEVSRF
jgi:hypothetical protein